MQPRGHCELALRSPEQISGWLKRSYLDEAAMQISHKSIYRTPVEHSTRHLMLVALPRGDHQAEAVADALGAAILRVSPQPTKSLTWDLGNEMAQHQRFSAETPTTKATFG